MPAYAYKSVCPRNEFRIIYNVLVSRRHLLVLYILTICWLGIPRLSSLGSCCLLWPNWSPCGEHRSEKWSRSSRTTCSACPSHHQFLGCTSRWASVRDPKGGWMTLLNYVEMHFIWQFSIQQFYPVIFQRESEAASDIGRFWFCWWHVPVG